MAAAAPSQQDVGRALRRARQRRHVQLDQVAAETRIPKRFLEALESNAPVEIYPAPVYARAFLREYAQFLEIDPAPLLAGFAKGAAPDVPLKSVREVVPPPRRWPARAVLGVSIAALTGLAAMGVISSKTPGPDVGTLPHSRPVAAPPESPATTPRPPGTAFSGIEASLHVLDRTWVTAVADGTVVYRGFWAAHWHRLKASKALDLTLGNAGGARLVLNGRRIPTGQTGQVVHLAVSFRRGRVHVNRA